MSEASQEFDRKFFCAVPVLKLQGFVLLPCELLFSSVQFSVFAVPPSSLHETAVRLSRHSTLYSCAVVFRKLFGYNVYFILTRPPVLTPVNSK